MSNVEKIPNLTHSGMGHSKYGHIRMIFGMWPHSKDSCECPILECSKLRIFFHIRMTTLLEIMIFFILPIDWKVCQFYFSGLMIHVLHRTKTTTKVLTMFSFLNVKRSFLGFLLNNDVVVSVSFVYRRLAGSFSLSWLEYFKRNGCLW